MLEPVTPATWSLSRTTERLLVFVIVATQIAILVAMIALDGLPLLLGERIKLQVIPLDPRDLFRGDYVVLGYDFNRLTAGRVEGLPLSSDDGWSYDNVSGRDVYVALVPKGDHYEATRISVKPPAQEPYLHGRMVGPSRIECGIEAFYVQQGEGRRLENLIRQRKLLAEIAVWHGHAKLVRLIE
jgi:uncharacterized membrane-anchored protein